MEKEHGLSYMRKNNIIIGEVYIGKNAIIEDFVVLGKKPISPPKIGYKLIIGDEAFLRTGTIIYSGTIIGDNFQTGDHARIRENCRIGSNVSIGTNTVVERDVIIKDDVRIHSNCFIPEYTIIEKNVWIGPGVIMTNVLHPPCPMFKKKPGSNKCISGPLIKKNAIVGAGAILMPGVIIGENSLVGAGAIVLDDVPPNTVVAGVPAKAIKKIEELECPAGYYKKGEVYSWRFK